MLIGLLTHKFIKHTLKVVITSEELQKFKEHLIYWPAENH